MSRELEIEREMFTKALHNAIAWQNRCVELMQIIEMFCLDAEAVGQSKPLTDEQIVKCWGQVSGTRHGYVAFARAIEAKLKELNT